MHEVFAEEPIWKECLVDTGHCRNDQEYEGGRVLPDREIEAEPVRLGAHPQIEKLPFHEGTIERALLREGVQIEGKGADVRPYQKDGEVIAI